MLTLIHLITALLPMLYALSAVNYLVFFIRRDSFAEKTTTPFLSFTLAVHLIYLLMRFFHFEHHPIATLAELLSFIAFAMTGIYLYVERIQRSRVTGVFILGIVVIIQLAASALLPHIETPKSTVFSNSLFGLHAFAAVLGYTALTVGAVYGLMYVLLYRDLKRKRFGLIFERLPSLDILANMSFGASLLGWIFLGITIGLGIAMSVTLFPNFYTDPKFIATVIAWAIYTLVIGAYFALGWRGARSVFLALAGYTVAVIAILSSVLTPHSFHDFLT